jgi:hypothetical protein
MAKSDKRQRAIKSASNADNTPAQQRGLRPPWQPGQSGNPAGRPKGSRNKLSEAFVADLYLDWNQNGVAAIARVRQERPWDYVRIVASLVPKQLDVAQSESLDDISDQELIEMFGLLKAHAGPLRNK